MRGPWFPGFRVQLSCKGLGVGFRVWVECSSDTGQASTLLDIEIRSAPIYTQHSTPNTLALIYTQHPTPNTLKSLRHNLREPFTPGLTRGCDAGDDGLR